MGGQSGLCTSFHDQYVTGCALVFLWSDLLVLWEALPEVDSEEQCPSHVTDDPMVKISVLIIGRTCLLFDRIPSFTQDVQRYSGHNNAI